mgnify:FL=1
MIFKIKRSDLEERPLRLRNTFNAQLLPARSLMGNFFIYRAVEVIGDLIIRSEGALIQHVRLKHPEMADDIKSKIPK